MKTITAFLLLLVFSISAFAGETNLKKFFKDGSLRKMDSSLASFDFEKNKKNVFYVWASWCPHCRDNAPKFLEHYNSVKNCSNIGISLINVDNDVNEGLRAIKEWNFTGLSLFHDGADVIKNQTKSGVPKLIVTDNEGQILNVHVGGTAIRDAMNGLKKAAEADKDCN